MCPGKDIKVDSVMCWAYSLGLVLMDELNLTDLLIGWFSDTFKSPIEKSKVYTLTWSIYHQNSSLPVNRGVVESEGDQ